MHEQLQGEAAWAAKVYSWALRHGDDGDIQRAASDLDDVLTACEVPHDHPVWDTLEATDDDMADVAARVEALL